MARAILVAALALTFAVPAQAHNERIAGQQARAKVVICKVFGPYCQQALDVSWCESKWYVWAGVGKHQYHGLFQMGSSERARYGHHPTNAWIQARAAWRYFVASGKDWSPWSCKP